MTTILTYLGAASFVVWGIGIIPLLCWFRRRFPSDGEI